MIALLVGFIIGLIMCIPLGPINIWTINTQIKKNSFHALTLALGGSIMDFVYFYIILTGLSFFSFSSTFELYFKGIGIFIIFLLGIKEIISAQKINDYDQKINHKKTPGGILKSLLLGIILYVSNPTLILTMSALGAFVKSLNLFPFTQINILTISFGLSFGSFTWFIFLVKLTGKYQEIIKTKYMSIFNKVSGALMIGLSLYMGQKLFYMRF